MSNKIKKIRDFDFRGRWPWDERRHPFGRALFFAFWH